MNFEGNAAGRWIAVEQDAARVASSESTPPAASKPHPTNVGNASGATASGSVTTSGGLPDSSPKKPVDEIGEKLAAEMKVFNRVVEELTASLDCNASFEDRVQYVMQSAADLFGVAPTWTAFYRAVLGGEGVLRKAIGSAEETALFECSDEHSKLLKMLTTLRSRDLPENDPFEPQRMITVRIPKSLHDAICDEANELAVSVNKLCISRLLQRVDKTMIPSSNQKRRGRRPGSNSNKPTGTDGDSSGTPAPYSVAASTSQPTSNSSARLPQGTESTSDADSLFD